VYEVYVYQVSEKDHHQSIGAPCGGGPLGAPLPGSLVGVGDWPRPCWWVWGFGEPWVVCKDPYIIDIKLGQCRFNLRLLR